MDGPKERPGQCGRTGNRPENAGAANLGRNDSTVIVLPINRWHIPMRRAYAIRNHQGRAKDHAVHLWRLAVQWALGQEVRQ